MSWRDWFRKEQVHKVGHESETADAHREDITTPPATLPKPRGGTRLSGSRPERAPAEAAKTPTAFPRFGIGDRIADTYLVKRVIEGGMATVYVAHHDRWQIDLVVKVPQPEILKNPEHRHRIVTEAEAWTALGMHPHIAYCYYVLPLNDVPLLVIEYLEGGSLREWIADGRCADLRVGLDLVIQACHGLEHAHARGLIHRDIKPENILLAADGTLKITDFGIARVAEHPAETIGPAGQTVAPGRTVGGIGTYEYMAPEQFVSAHDVDARADIFALGVCLYEMLCGRRPYAVATGPRQEAPAPQALRGDAALPESLCTLLQRCVDWDPARRPASARELRLALCRIYEECFEEPNPWAELPMVSLEADGWNNRGVSYLELGQQTEALHCFAQALKANPTHLEATFNQGLLQWRRGEIDDLEVLHQLDRCATGGADAKALAIAQAEIHQERYDPDAARTALASYAGLYEAHFGSKESSRVCLLRILGGHKDRVSAVAVTPDGRFAVSGSHDRTLKLWDLSIGQCLWTTFLHPGWVLAVAVDRSGRWALSGGQCGEVILWDLATGQCVWMFREEEGFQVASVVLTLDGHWGMSVSTHMFKKRSNVRLWDLTTGQCLRTLEGHAKEVTSVALTADGRRGLSGSEDKTLKLWDFTTGQCLRTLEGHSESVTSVALTPDDRRALSGSRDGTLRLWDLTTGQCLRALEGHAEFAGAVVLTPDGRRAISGSEALKIWDLETGRCLRTLEGAEIRSRAALACDGHRAVSGDWDGGVRVWDVEGARRILQVFKPSRPRSFSAIRAEQETRNARLYLATHLWEERKYQEAYTELIALWEPVGFRSDERMDALYAQLRPRGVIKGLLVGTDQLLAGREACTSIALTPDGGLGLSGSKDGCLKVWDLRTGQCLRALKGHTGEITAIAVASDGRQVLSGSTDKRAIMWDLTTGQCVHTLQRASDVGEFVALAADARRGLSQSKERTFDTFEVWDLKVGKCLRTLEARRPSLYFTLGLGPIALTPDGRRGLSKGEDSTLKVWDLETGECLHILEGHRGNVGSLAITPDGRLGLSGGYYKDEHLRLWDLETGGCLHSLEGHSDGVYSVGLTPDGRWGLSGGIDGDLSIWDLVRGKCLRTWFATSCVSEMAIARDGCRAFVAYADGTLACWRFIWSLEFPGR